MMMLFSFMLTWIISLAESNHTMIGILGGSIHENIEYKFSVSVTSISTEQATVNFTFHEESGDKTEVLAVDPNAISELTMHLDENTTASRITTKRINVSAIEDFNLQVFVTRKNYTEGFRPLPSTMLGLEYYVSTFCEFGGFCQFSITATDVPRTNVYLKIPNKVTEVVFCVGETRFRSHQHTNFTLKANKVLLVESPHDLTGTRIVADHNVVVMAGARDLNISDTTSHLVEQLLPVEKWGQNFIVTSLGITQYGDIIQITSSQYNTTVEMTGFPTIELPKPGMTVKRRLDFGMTSTISTSRPVQVMQVSGLTYGSNVSVELGMSTNPTVSNATMATLGSGETTTPPSVSSATSTNIVGDTTNVTIAPGMSVVPAIENFDYNSHTTCGSKGGPSLLHFFSTAPDLHYFKDYNFNTDQISIAQATSIPYSRYNLYEVSAYDSGTVTHIGTENQEQFGGIIRCVNSGVVMPMGLAEKAAPSCTVNTASPVYADGLDNDCDGEIDEDYCFENKMVTTHFSIHSSTVLDFHTENITGASLIKLRIKTCGTTTVQLRDDDGGMYMLRISRAYLVGHSCFPNCTESKTEKVGTYHQYFSNCTDEIAFYWIRVTENKICAHTGPIPDDDCDSAVVWTNHGGGLNMMKLGGLMQDATFWIDIDRPDCGTLESDWRCEDGIRNCDEYQTGFCSNPDFAVWVDKNCRKYCGLCTPDGHGRKFYVTNPFVAVETLVTVRNATSQTFQDVAYSAPDQIIYRKSSETDEDGNIFELTLHVLDSQPLVVIVTDADAVVTVLYRTSEHEHMFVVYPVDAFGTEYTVNIPRKSGDCELIAVQANTVVEMAHQNGVTLLPTLSLGTKHIESVFIANGTVFRANRPFTVFCGSVAGWNQMLPQHSLGKDYIVPDDLYYSLTAKVRAVATRDNTVIQAGNFSTYALDKRGSYANIVYEGGYNITSNNPISVGMMVQQSAMKAYAILPSVDNFMDNPITISDVNSLVAVVDSAGQSNMLTNANTNYILPQAQSFTLTVFSGYSNWINRTSVMLYPTPSVEFTNIIEHDLCRLTNGMAGDRLDNDCDGLVDEDICFTKYGALREDQDLDGGFGEDCYQELTGESTISPPNYQYCSNIHIVERPEEECWRPHMCDCSWVEQLEYRQTLNDEERDAMNDAEIQKYQKDMELDEEQLSSEVTKKQSAEDERTSSTTIGYAGIVFIAILFGLIFAVDALRLYSVFCG